MAPLIRPHSTRGIAATCLAGLSLSFSALTWIPAASRWGSDVWFGMFGSRTSDSPWWVPAMICAAFGTKLGLRAIGDRDTRGPFRWFGIAAAVAAVFVAVHVAVN